MRITDVISKKKKNKELEPGEQKSPMSQADWKESDKLINDENGFIKPQKVPDVDKYIRSEKKKSERHQRRQ